VSDTDIDVRELAQSAQRSAFRAAVLPLTAVVAALSTWGVNYQFNQAVPVIELASISFEPASDADGKFRPSDDLDLLRAGSDARMFTGTDPVSLRAALEWPLEAQRYDGALDKAIQNFDKALQIVDRHPESADPAIEAIRAAALRRELLMLDGPTRFYFSSLMVAGLQGDRQRQRFAGDPRYQRHPEGLADGDLSVTREGMSAFSLADFTPNAGNVAQSATLLYRRLLLVADRGDLKLALGFAKEEALRRKGRLKEFSLKLQEELEAANPKRVRATMIVQNFGLQSAMFRDAGVLVLRSPDGALTPIRMDRADENGLPDPTGAFVVPGGQSQRVEYFSEEPLQSMDAAVRAVVMRDQSGGDGTMMLERLRRKDADETVQSSALALGRQAHEVAWERLSKEKPKKKREAQ
jgi:hypothetical protein